MVVPDLESAVFRGAKPSPVAPGSLKLGEQHEELYVKHDNSNGEQHLNTKKTKERENCGGTQWWFFFKYILEQRKHPDMTVCEKVGVCALLFFLEYSTRKSECPTLGGSTGPRLHCPQRKRSNFAVELTPGADGTRKSSESSQLLCYLESWVKEERVGGTEVSE